MAGVRDANSSDSDAPEELTAQQGNKQDEEISKIQRENKLRVSREGKERRRKWAQRKSQQSNSAQNVIHDVAEIQLHEAQDTHGMLPNNVVELLAARERRQMKQVASSDEEETIVNEPIARKKKQKCTGPEPVILKDIPLAKCLETSLEFLKRRKMDVTRSQATLKNAERALRFISSAGSLLTKS